MASIYYVAMLPAYPPNLLMRVAVWSASLAVIVLLGIFRVTTDAEFTFFSMAIIPVVAVAWIGGFKDGVWLSALAAVIWAVADLGSDRRFSADWIPIANALTRFATDCLLAYLTATVRRQLTREHEMASHDALTGLLNRRAFFELGEAEILRSRRYGRSLAVAFLDLDDFKPLNDRMGHEVGDMALKAVAVALKSTLRETDQVSRIGGDEFAVLLPEIGYDHAAEAGRKIAAAVDAALSGYPPATASVGVVWFEDPGTVFQDMIRAADELMYEVKQAGKHGVLTRRQPKSLDAPSSPPRAKHTTMPAQPFDP